MGQIHTRKLAFCEAIKTSYTKAVKCKARVPHASTGVKQTTSAYKSPAEIFSLITLAGVIGQLVMRFSRFLFLHGFQ